jgi:hypothetical protein
MKTTSYEISKKLAEIGFKAETEKAFDNKGTPISCHKKICILKEKSSNSEIYGLPACDLESILQALPNVVNYNEELNIKKYEIGYYYFDYDCVICGIGVEKQENELLTDTAARLLILLHEKGMVNFN